MSISTILNFLCKNNFRFLYVGLISLSVFALSSAYFAEYVMKLAPCSLCIYARFPYLALIKLSITGLVIRKLSKYTMILIILTLFCASSIALYHSGVERGFWEPSKICNTLIHIPDHLSVKDIRKMFESQENTPSCTKAALKIFNLSLAEWNLLLNSGLLAGVIFLWSRRSYSNI